MVSLDLVHRIHTSLLDPYSRQVIYRHLDSVHASGRRSRTLDVGTVSGAMALSLMAGHRWVLCFVVFLDAVMDIDC
jgi:methylase of polypeptide subunit release factors